MILGDDERAVALQVGASILLAFVVVAITLYQTQVVPQQNKEIEFNHNQKVQEQMLDLRNAVVSVPGGGAGKSVTVSLGTSYPERTIFVNPPRPAGQLRTTPAANVTIENAVAAGEVGDFWSGVERNATTRALVYRPSYRVYGNAPVTAYENSVVNNRYPSRNLTATDQLVVRNRTITLVTLRGDFQAASSEDVSVDLQAVSTSTRTVAVTDGSGPVTVTVPTTLPESAWTELLSGQPYVTGISYSSAAGPYGRLSITLERGRTYRLRMAAVGVDSGAVEPGPAYLTPVGGDRASVAENGTRELVVEVRDRFNNPVSGVDLNVSTSRPDSTVTADPDDTDTDGRVVLEYDAPQDVDGTAQVTDRINVSYVGDDTNTSAFDVRAPENATINVTVSNADDSGVGGGGGDNSINPNSSGAVILQGATIVESCGNNGKTPCQVDVSLKNRDSVSRNITELQYTFYSVDGQGGSTPPSPESLTFQGTVYAIRGQFEDVSPKFQFAAGQTRTLSLRFYKQPDGTNAFEVGQGDFFVITVGFEDGTVNRYFVAPTN